MVDKMENRYRNLMCDVGMCKYNRSIFALLLFCCSYCGGGGGYSSTEERKWSVEML